VRRERQLAGIEKAREQNEGRCPWGGRRPGTRVRVTPEKEEAIVRMGREGRKIAQIARVVGLTRKTVYSVLASAESRNPLTEPEA
jgi:DNA invertase Pin-like site-specific DNA recombinase